MKQITVTKPVHVKDLSGEAELGMNGTILPGKQAKAVPVKDLVVSICAPPTDYQTFLHPYKQEWEFQLN